MEPVPHLEEKINSALSEIVNETKVLCGDGLVSVYLYGSAATSGYVHEKSNLNTLIVLKRIGIEDLKGISDIYRKRRKLRFVAPLVLTPQYISSSIDVFPIEFLDIKETSVLLAGEDALKGVHVELSSLREQCEREIKGQLIRMRGTFLEVHGDRDGMEKLVSSAVSSIVFPMKNILRLMKLESGGGSDAVIKSCCASMNVNASPFLQALEIKKGERRASLEELYAVISGYMDSVEEIAGKIDLMKSEGRL